MADQHLLERLMREALSLAERAITLGEVPIASVLALPDGKIVGWGWNELNAKQDRTAHAEMVAFRDACGRYPVDREDLILVSTLEPCIMCFGASILCGVETIVYGVRAPADGGCARVKPPESPESKMPQVIPDMLAGEAILLFKKWLDQHLQQDSQRAYIEQLLQLNRSEA